jgi:AraC-like DNA-binding protein
MTAVTGLTLRSYDDAPLSHSHDHHQLVLALEGRLEMEVAGRGGLVDAAALVVVAGGETHSCRASGRNRFLVLDWEEDDAADDLAARFVDAARRRPFVGLDPALLPLLRFLDTAVADERIPSDERQDWGRLLLRRLADGAPRATSYPRRLSRALGFVEANLARPITVAHIAGAAATSAGHLHGLFRRHLGRAPMAHVAERRLDRAMAALRDSNAPIAEIALACGYSDQTALTRALRRRHGVTPAAYRRGRQAAR